MQAIPNAGRYVEWTIENNGWTQGLFEPLPEVREGRVAVPSGPGWGVTVDPKWLQAAERKESER